MNFPKACLINLEASTDRLAAASAQLDAFGIGFDRVSAVDGRKLTIDAYPQ